MAARCVGRSMEKNSVGMDADISVRIDRLMYTILRKWRTVLRGGLVTALLLAMAISLISAIGFFSPEQREKAENKYEIALFSYETKGETLQRDIQNLYDSLNRQKEYNANSLLMRIDPYNKYEAAVTYYIDTNYQIMPEYQYQNIDYGPRLVQMYAEYMKGGEMYAQLAREISGITDMRYIEELIETSIYHSMGMIELRICTPSEDLCREMLNIISKGMDEKQARAAELIGAHTLMQLNETIVSVVDTRLDEIQKYNIQAMTDETVALEEKQEELKGWEEEDVPKAPYAPENIAKRILKAAVLGFCLGMLLIAGVETVRYAFSDRVAGVVEFQDRFSVSVLGVLPGKIRKDCVIDRWIDRMDGTVPNLSDAQALTAVAAENIAMAAKGRADAVALIGSVPVEELEQLAQAFRRSACAGVTVLAAGDPGRCAQAAEMIRRADAVVMVERQDCASYSDIGKLCRQMTLWNKEVLGIVFTGADARNG